MRSMSCFCKNRDTTSGPKVKDTPRSFSDQPVMSLSGSDHSRSQSRPQSGIYEAGVSKSTRGRALGRRLCVRGGEEKEGATYISGTHDPADLLHRVKIWAQTTMHGEDLLIDNGSDGEAVEAVGE